MKRLKFSLLVISLVVLTLSICGFPNTYELHLEDFHAVTEINALPQDKHIVNEIETELNSESLIWDVGKSQVKILEEDALADYDAMWILLENNYPFLEIIKSDMGIDWQKVREHYRIVLSERCYEQYIYQEDFIDVISNCINEFKSVGHLSVISPGMYTHLVDMFTSMTDHNGSAAGNLTIPNSLAEMLRRTLTILQSSKVTTFYEYYSLIESKPESVKLYNNVKSRGYEALYNEVRASIVEGAVGSDIPYIKITKFGWSSPECVPIAIEILHNFFDENSKASNIIIDLQGNRGGNSAVWMQGIVSYLISNSVLEENFYGFKDGYYNKYLWGANTPVDFGYQKISENELIESMPSLILSELSNLDFYKSEHVYLPLENSICYTGTLWLLIDENNYSSADAFAAFCKSTEFAVLVGTTTGGNGAGGQPYTFTLPKSGLLIYYDPFFSFNKDGSCNAIKGTAPDIEKNSNLNALETCLLNIEEINNEPDF